MPGFGLIRASSPLLSFSKGSTFSRVGGSLGLARSSGSTSPHSRSAPGRLRPPLLPSASLNVSPCRQLLGRRHPVPPGDQICERGCPVPAGRGLGHAYRGRHRRGLRAWLPPLSWRSVLQVRKVARFIPELVSLLLQQRPISPFRALPLCGSVWRSEDSGPAPEVRGCLWKTVHPVPAAYGPRQQP